MDHRDGRGGFCSLTAPKEIRLSLRKNPFRSFFPSPSPPRKKPVSCPGAEEATRRSAPGDRAPAMILDQIDLLNLFFPNKMILRDGESRIPERIFRRGEIP
ncbi:MAG: hypothetical protein AMJ94_05955 [Deltaproteobacteria bacterium SM23_61]|nr:MAG: hypothetical protein AMJ94_05955 [Deltaproteobacteria bacterium SM23_61]